MAELASRERLQPSLLDRLTDDAPERRRESLDQQTLSMQQLRRAVLRDLAWLLNTTNLVATDESGRGTAGSEVDDQFRHPEFRRIDRHGAQARQSGDRDRRCYPRLRAAHPGDSLKVRLRPLEDGETSTAITFEIQGELWAQPVPQQLFLETMIELETRMAVVTDAKARG